MDKPALRMKLREINKAVCPRIDQAYFDEIEKDITGSRPWFALLLAMEGADCDKTYCDLVEQCLKVCARLDIGDKTE